MGLSLAQAIVFWFWSRHMTFSSLANKGKRQKDCVRDCGAGQCVQNISTQRRLGIDREEVKGPGSERNGPETTPVLNFPQGPFVDLCMDQTLDKAVQTPKVSPNSTLLFPQGLWETLSAYKSSWCLALAPCQVTDCSEAVLRAWCLWWDPGTSLGSHNPSTHPTKLVAGVWPSDENNMLSISHFSPALSVPLFLQEPPSASNHLFKIPLGPSSRATDLEMQALLTLWKLSYFLPGWPSFQ